MPVKSFADRRKGTYLNAQTKKKKLIGKVHRIRRPKSSVKFRIKASKKSRVRAPMPRGKNPTSASKVRFTRHRRAITLAKTKQAAALIDTDVNQGLQANGVSQMRPEIIAQVAFQPVFTRRNKVRGNHDFYELQKSSRFLYQENASLMLDKLKEDPILEGEITALLQKYNKVIRGGKRRTRRLGYVIMKVGLIRRDFDFKDRSEILIERLNARNSRRARAKKRRLNRQADKYTEKAEAAGSPPSPTEFIYLAKAARLRRMASRMGAFEFEQMQIFWVDIMGYSKMGRVNSPSN